MTARAPLLRPADRREDRLLVAVHALGGAALALGFESWGLAGATLLTALLVALVRPRRVAAPPALEGLLGLLAAALGLLVSLHERRAGPGLALFLLVAQAIKLAAPRTRRDEGLGLVVGLVLAGAAASEGVSPLFGLVLLADIACLLALASLRARRDLIEVAAGARAPVVAAPGPTARRPAAALRRALALAPGLALAGAFFFAFPRVGAHLLPQQRDSRDRLSGFTEVVGLDDIGRIQQSDATAFRAELVAGTLPVAPYWRGRALDHYDGASWHATRVFGFAGVRLDGTDELRDPLVAVPEDAPTAEVVIYQEALGTRCLFTVGTTRGLHFKSARPAVVDRDALGTILCFPVPAVPIAYRLVAHPQVEVPRLHLTAVGARRVREHCQRLPDAVDRPRLAEYSARVLRARGVPEDAPASAVARALEDHLQTTFRYSLDANRTPGTEPVADFLFTLRAGHCEYFASALAVLLRVNGIPSRLVSGFRGGVFNAWAGTWTVRQRDAHAWVEAETEHGWVRLDATPDLDEAGGGGALTRLFELTAALTDWLELRWYKWVIAFDAPTTSAPPCAPCRAAAGRPRGARRRPRGRRRPGRRRARPAVALAIAGAAAAGLVALARGQGARRAARRGVTGPDAPLVAEVLDALARRGVVRRDGETLKEVLARARPALGPPVDDLVAWLPAYHAARFGGRPSDAAANAAARRALAALRAATAPPPSASSS
ncbi:MAG: transglutaminaseTgpA domain-containing protein [Planctomycetes bacterium]|nr:transglutaminaseTgpA domain-containing protein [Planctomycetota bacterium]